MRPNLCFEVDPGQLSSLDQCRVTLPKLPGKILEELQQSGVRTYRLPMFIVLYGCAAAGAVTLATILSLPWIYIAALPLYLIAAASLHGISLFTHEGVHGVLSRNHHWNRILSILCALPVLQNYSAYKVLHLQHHANLGLAGDPDRYRNYTRWTWLVFLMHWGRLLVGYPVYLVMIPILGFRQGQWEDRIWIAIEVVLLLLIAGVAWCFLPTGWVVHGWLLPMLAINTMVNIRGMSQHTLLADEADVVRGTRTILSNPVVRFFMCNENYHLEHHLYPSVPWYHLPRLHQLLKAELIQYGAPYIANYLTFVGEFAIASLRRQSVGTVTIGAPNPKIADNP